MQSTNEMIIIRAGCETMTYASSSVEPNDLTATKHKAIPRLGHLHIVPHPAKLLDNSLRDTFFDANLSTGGSIANAEPGRIERLLWVQTMVHHA